MIIGGSPTYSEVSIFENAKCSVPDLNRVLYHDGTWVQMWSVISEPFLLNGLPTICNWEGDCIQLDSFWMYVGSLKAPRFNGHAVSLTNEIAWITGGREGTTSRAVIIPLFSERTCRLHHYFAELDTQY